MPRTPMPHSVRRFPPRKPVIPSTASPRRATARYGALPPTSEPRTNERQRQALRAAKTAVAAKAVTRGGPPRIICLCVSCVRTHRLWVGYAHDGYRGCGRRDGLVVGGAG